jgi:hypothetical protein
MDNKRQAFRYPIKIIITTKVANGKDAPVSYEEVRGAVSTDISPMGLGMYAAHFMPEKSHLYLEIDGAPFGSARDILATGEVRYSLHVQGALYRYGVRFLHLSDEDRERIAAVSQPG